MISGFVTILGRPNAGKSTLLNALLSKKVSIVTPKAQTTRDDIMGIYNEKDLQIVFIDTPGLFDGDKKLDKMMNRSARRSISDVDAILYVIDCHANRLDEDLKRLSSIKSDKPIFVLLNKIDLMKAPEMEKLIATVRNAHPDKRIIELSALTNFGLKDVKEALKEVLPEGVPYFPSDMITDKDKPFMIREVVREKLLHFLRDEIPHQAAVRLKAFREGEKEIAASCLILVEKDSQKGIIIGKSGTMIKKIGTSARTELERMWKKHLDLRLAVEVSPNWRMSDHVLAELGYGNKRGQD